MFIFNQEVSFVANYLKNLLNQWQMVNGLVTDQDKISAHASNNLVTSLSKLS
jgi:hypothetical protein